MFDFLTDTACVCYSSILSVLPERLFSAAAAVSNPDSQT